MKVVEKLQVTVDTQDNIIKINDGEWVPNLDLDTWEPANDLLGIRQDWDNRTIYIKSNSNKLISTEIIGLANYSVISGNVAHVYVPLMRLHLEDSDIFYLEVEILKEIPLHSYLKQKIVMAWKKLFGK